MLPADEPVPQHCPTPRELADLELLTSGALAPLERFDEPGSPVTLTLPEELRGREVELVDPEGLPLARLAADGTVTSLSHAQHGPFRRLHLAPADVRREHAGATFVPVVDALTEGDLARLRAVPGRVVLLALVGPGTPALSPVALLRATLLAAGHLPDAAVVAVPLASHGDPDVDHALGLRVVASYAGDDPVQALADDEDGTYPDDIAAVVEADRPGPEDQGLVLFFTGLSGSGKSTLAQSVMDTLLEQGGRSVTTLDGDVVRRHLSAGLTFSRADRETNIRRIGWVAAEISRHGGLAVCSPIAPFDETRQAVRAMVADAGGAFFLVHVATPLEECERRDRKGLYAKARRGEIPDFTGISSPYEEPTDADLRIDTTGRTIEDCRDEVLAALRAEGYVGPAAGTEPAPEAERPIELLFVCTANICRSPYLELRARQLLGDDPGVVFASAGTHGFADHPSDEGMLPELESRGVDAGAFRSRRLTREMVDRADLVVTAEASHRTYILDEQPQAFRKVMTLGQLAAGLELVDPSLRGRALVAALTSRRVASSPDHDIDDPYRRGPEAAARAAARMDDLLQRVVPRFKVINPADSID